MKKRVFQKVLVLLLLSCTVVDAAEDWERLLSWVDKYPSVGVGSSKAGLLSQHPVKVSLRQILPKSELDTLARFDVEAPVRRVGEYIVVHKCLPHNCPNDMAMVIIDVRNEKLWAGFFSRERGRVSTRWYGTADDYSVLPEAIREEFLSRHGN